MMLRYSFDLDESADLLDGAVQKVLEGGLRTADIMQDGKTQASTSAMGDAVIAQLESLSG